MSCELRTLSIAALDPPRMAHFWATFLGWRAQGTTVTPTDDTSFELRFRPADEPKQLANLMHLDLRSDSPSHQQRLVDAALRLGARHIDIGQLPEEKHVVLADPEGNEFCVVEPGNNFLADCGLVGCVSSDGTQAEGYFWSAALDYPLVWDQDEETAIRSRAGGPKISWGGPPLAPKEPVTRWRFELAATDIAAETDRLVGLGASVIDARSGLLADPDGNQFVLAAT